MNKIIKCFLMLILLLQFHCVSFAQEEPTLFDSAREFEKYSNYNAKPVNDLDIDKAIDKVKNLHKSKKQILKEKQNKGQALSGGLSGIINKPYMLLQLPVDIYNKDKIIRKGFYNTVYVGDDSLLLRQGHKKVAKINLNKALKEPDNDDLYYVDAINSNGYLKIIYGSMDKHLENYFQIAH